ncbi:hypothetical protein TSAR_008964 [Trichomalopsis sarcophagae]|uniref:Uncharacterized protein n=1 Tax=Trichomalopsis sarcophagae TaxID=543379 RepID=A0A232EE10_9HYME|nr:hypothetical protein TSAR_008964 [Trichomalopsis sarcophagae]
MLQISLKLLKMTLILSTLSTRYLGVCCRRDIRVQRPQKPLRSRAELILLNTMHPMRLFIMYTLYF